MRSIAFIIPNLQMGGAEKALITVANQWIKTADITIITFDSGETFFKIDERIKIIPLHTTKNNAGFLSPLLNSVKRYRRLSRTIKKLAPDITIPFMDTSIIWTFFSRPYTKVPLIMVFQVTPSKAITRSQFRFLIKKLYKKADAAVILTHDMQSVFDRMNIQLPARTFVIPNPLTSDIVFKGEMNREDIILAVGRLADQKQFDLLIRIFYKLQPTHWILWIVGEGENRKALEDLIVRYELQNKVILQGAQKEVSKFYAKAKIFAMPSSFEGYPVALCEAMANGCACIAFDCELGPAAIIENNVNGLLIADQDEEKFTEGLSQLMHAPADVSRFSGKARSFFEKVDIKELIHKWEEAVEEVLKK
jgi:GalNAc-alpha-(1->4)-GalNAc-alpha-(1->3)-diNAcBac-PP-undecaprenol alpha-1,4-N-acetyl-D-galactosaminyltransferase